MVVLESLLDWSSKWNYYSAFNFVLNNGEPNQFGGANEDYAHITAPGVHQGK
jgi:hypothetical protein